MTEEQQKLAKAFRDLGPIYDFVKKDLLDFGIMNTEGATDAEVGARYRIREQELERLRRKFNKYELLD